MTPKYIIGSINLPIYIKKEGIFPNYIQIKKEKNVQIIINKENRERKYQILISNDIGVNKG